MRWMKNALLVLFTLALVAAGAFMPFAASRLQDARQTGAETRSFDSFLLTLKKKGELSQILRFLADNQYYVFIEDDPNTADLSAAEAVDAAKEAVEEMFRCGIISKDVLAFLEANEAAGVDMPDVEMARMESELDEEAASFIVWGVEWPNLGIQIWLDDASGKAFQIFFYDVHRYAGQDYSDKNASGTGMTKEQLYAQMHNWQLFLQNYYEVEVQDIEEVPYSFARNFLLYIELEDGGGWIPMRLYLHDEGASLIVEYYVPGPDES